MRSLYVLLDADGAVYNHKFRYLLDVLIDKYGDQIRQMTFANSADTAEFAKVLKQEVQQIDLRHHGKNYHRLYDCIVRKSSSYTLDADLQEDVESNPGRLHHLVGLQFIRWLQEIDPGIVDNVVVKANEVLLGDIVKTISDEGNIDRVVLMCASGRQSAALDDVNRRHKGTRLFFGDLPVLENALLAKVGELDCVCHVTHDYFLQADIFSGLHSGASYKMAVNNPGGHEEGPHAGTDHSKMLLMYGLLHRIASNDRRRTPPLVHYYEDTSHIVDEVRRAFSANHHRLLPKGMHLKIRKYKGSSKMLTHHLTGEGRIDRTYRHSINKMVQLCGGNPDEIVNFNENVFQRLPMDKFLEWRDPDKRRGKTAVEVRHRKRGHRWDEQSFFSTPVMEFKEGAFQGNGLVKRARK